MAYLKSATGTKKKIWCVSFRWNGVHYTRSCCTGREDVAKRILASVQETVELLKTERLTIPDGVDPGDWILSGGKAVTKSTQRTNPSKQKLAVVCAEYLNDQTGKAESTLQGENIHIARLKEVLRPGTSLTTIDKAVLQRYAQKRGRMKYRGRPITGTTIRKELGTFRQVWRWARRSGRVAVPCPLYDADGKWQIVLPKASEGKRFQTWRQIKRQVAIGELTHEEQQELWSGLFLDNDQVLELLDHVKQHAVHDFIYPMFAFVAYTGCRRSELLRSRIIDLDFDEMEITIRERKRRKDLSSSLRTVPMHERLASILETWLDKHPGGRYSFVPPDEMAHRNSKAKVGRLTKDKAHTHFKAALSSSKWSVVPGFHVLRHSFGANLARTGRVSETTIGEWMGHTTKEMRKLYQHLFPQDGAEKISVLA